MITDTTNFPIPSRPDVAPTAPGVLELIRRSGTSSPTLINNTNHSRPVRSRTFTLRFPNRAQVKTHGGKLLLFSSRFAPQALIKRILSPA